MFEPMHRIQTEEVIQHLISIHAALQDRLMCTAPSVQEELLHVHADKPLIAFYSNTNTLRLCYQFFIVHYKDRYPIHKINISK